MKAKIQQQGEDTRKKIEKHFNELEQCLKEQKEHVPHQVMIRLVRGTYLAHLNY